jgi:GNAT superfamily N-acetyltransferase
MEIRPARAGDEAAWRALWEGYCDFYEEDVPELVTAATWRRLLDPHGPMGALVAVAGGEVVGFADYVVHPSTWAEADSCYLEDLFVAPAARGGGAGRALIDGLLELARSRGWEKLYWHTRDDNARARALYDSFGPADGFVRYVVRADGPNVT